jgi:hypothetical protein
MIWNHKVERSWWKGISQLKQEKYRAKNTQQTLENSTLGQMVERPAKRHLGFERREEIETLFIST